MSGMLSTVHDLSEVKKNALRTITPATWRDLILLFYCSFSVCFSHALFFFLFQKWDHPHYSALWPHFFHSKYITDIFPRHWTVFYSNGLQRSNIPSSGGIIIYLLIPYSWALDFSHVWYCNYHRQEHLCSGTFVFSWDFPKKIPCNKSATLKILKMLASFPKHRLSNILLPSQFITWASFPNSGPKPDILIHQKQGNENC